MPSLCLRNPDPPPYGFKAPHPRWGTIWAASGQKKPQFGGPWILQFRSRRTRGDVVCFDHDRGRLIIGDGTPLKRRTDFQNRIGWRSARGR